MLKDSHAFFIPETLVQQSSHYNPLYGLPVAFEQAVISAAAQATKRTGQSPSGSLEGYSLGWHRTPEVASIYVLTLCMYF